MADVEMQEETLEEVLRGGECTICSNKALEHNGKWNQCTGGHLICDACFGTSIKATDNCPTCGVIIGEVRSLAMRVVKEVAQHAVGAAAAAVEPMVINAAPGKLKWRERIGPDGRFKADLKADVVRAIGLQGAAPFNIKVGTIVVAGVNMMLKGKPIWKPFFPGTVVRFGSDHSTVHIKWMCPLYNEPAEDSVDAVDVRSICDPSLRVVKPRRLSKKCGLKDVRLDKVEGTRFRGPFVSLADLLEFGVQIGRIDIDALELTLEPLLYAAGIAAAASEVAAAAAAAFVPPPGSSSFGPAATAALASVASVAFAASASASASAVAPPDDDSYSSAEDSVEEGELPGERKRLKVESYPPVDPSILERMLNFGDLNMQREALEVKCGKLEAERDALKSRCAKLETEVEVTEVNIVGFIKKNNRLLAEKAELERALRAVGLGWGGAGGPS